MVVFFKFEFFFNLVSSYKMHKFVRLWNSSPDSAVFFVFFDYFDSFYDFLQTLATLFTVFYCFLDIVLSTRPTTSYPFAPLHWPGPGGMRGALTIIFLIFEWHILTFRTIVHSAWSLSLEKS